MGIITGFILFKGICDWCGRSYQRQKPLEICLGSSRGSYTSGGLSRNGDYINFCSRECYKLYKDKEEMEEENRRKEYWNGLLIGGYTEERKCRCFLCHKDGNRERIRLYHHHLTPSRNFVVRLCFSCHRKAHTDPEVDKYLRRELEAYFGITLGEDELTPRWGGRGRASTI